MLQDVRYAWRQLLKTPVFSCAAIATLAIGIGATTAIFSTVNATLLRPLPFPHPEELVAVRTRLPDGRVTTGFCSPVEIARLNDPNVSIVRATGIASQPFDATLMRDDGTPTHVVLTGVGEGFFDLLGLPMLYGQSFTPEHHAPGNQNAPIFVVVSHHAWTTFFGRDPGIVGKPFRIAEAPVSATIVGVAPPELDFPRGVDFWFNLRLNPRGVAHFLDGILRLRRGTTLERLRAEIAPVMAGIGRDFPASGIGREYVVQPLVNSLVGDLRPTLLIILGATALLLVLASVNVTNLLLARGTVRSREVAVRAALGAGWGRIVRQLLTESMVLATVGAIAGLAFAYAAVRLLLVLGASKLPRLDTVPFDARVLLFTFAVLLVTGLAMGLAPAWRLATTDVKVLMNESGRSASGGRATSRMMGAMIVTEIALAVTLVAGAGWLVQSFGRLRTASPGFTAAGRLIVDVRPTKNFRNPEDARVWSSQLMEHVGAVHGAARVAAAQTFPLRNDRDPTVGIAVNAEPTDPSRVRSSRARSVTPGLFAAMGTRIVAGRDFTPDDRMGTVPVAIVNRTFVRQLLGGREPLQTRFAFGYPDIDYKTLLTIVGVVEDIQYKALGGEPEAAFYTPQMQTQFPFLRHAIVIDTQSANPAAIVQAIQEELRRFDAQLAADYETAPSIVAATLSRQQLGMTLMLIFGATALALAAVGIYGVIAYAAAQRRGEVATRVALGATSSDVFWLIMAQGRRLAIVGVLLGAATAYAAGRAVAASVYAMRAADPIVLTIATLLVIAISLVATLIPAARAAQADPALALRAD